METHTGISLEDVEKEWAAKDPAYAAIKDKLDEQEKYFGNALRALVNNSGLSPDEIDRRVGLGEHATEYFMGGEIRPQRGTVVKYSHFFNVPPEQLWEGFRK